MDCFFGWGETHVWVWVIAFGVEIELGVRLFCLVELKLGFFKVVGLGLRLGYGLYCFFGWGETRGLLERFFLWMVLNNFVMLMI